MSKRAKAPPGCYWRGGTLWGRVVSAGKEHRWSLDTDDAKVAKARRAAGRARIIALKHGDARRTFTEVAHAWGEWIVHQVAPSTVTRYAVSLGQLDPWLAGKHLDEVGPALLAEIARERIAGGVTPATAKRDLVALVCPRRRTGRDIPSSGPRNRDARETRSTGTNGSRFGK